MNDIELRRIPLSTCKRCANGDVRSKNNINGICNLIASELDGLPLRCVGEWANDKIYYLCQYFGIFSNGMKKKWKGNLQYLEICSGPGRCCTRDNFEQDGTALAIINNAAFENIRRAIFIDHDVQAVDTLNARIEKLGHGEEAHAYVGDYNDPESICQYIRDFKGLTLCLIDPTDCSLPFSLIYDIFMATKRKTDFIISVFDKVDFKRNAVNATIDPKYRNLQKKYTSFLGDEEFFLRDDVIQLAKDQKHREITRLFNEAYEHSLQNIGLSYQGREDIGAFYHLLFASGHERGLNFWKKSHKYNRHGQREFSFTSESR